MENMELKQIVESLEEQDSLLELNQQNLDREYHCSNGELGPVELKEKQKRLNGIHQNIIDSKIKLGQIATRIDTLKASLSAQKEFVGNILDDIKRSKRVKFFLLSEFDILGLLSMNLGALLVTLTIGLSLTGLMNFFIFEIVYMSSFVVVRLISKKTLNSILLEKLIPEYASFNNDCLKLENEIEQLCKNQKIANDLLEKADGIGYKNYKLLCGIEEMLRLNTMSSKIKGMINIFEYLGKSTGDGQSTTEEEPPKVFSIGTMPGSETL